MSRKLRVGIIGAGAIGTRSHLPGYQRDPRTEVVALCDPNKDRARAIADEHNIPRIFTDYREMLRVAELDLVSVCTPNALHAPITITALEAGVHVLCEKPMARTMAEAQAMVSAANRTGCKLTIGFHNRFRPPSVALKAFVDGGLLGEIYYIAISMLRRSGIPGYGSWFTSKEMAGGGALIDAGVHGLDLALWFMGHPRPVSVLGVTFSEFGPRRKGLGGWGADILAGDQQFDVEDLAVAMVRFENGAVVTIETSWAGYSVTHERLQLFGQAGGAELDLSYHEVERRLRVFTDLEDQPVEVFPTLDGPAVSGHARLIEDFVDSIIEDREPVVTPEQGLLVTEIVDGIYQSAQSGKEMGFKSGGVYEAGL